MKNIIKQIKKVAKHTRLSASEKAEMKSVLVRYAKANPAKAGAFASHSIPSPFTLDNFRNKKGISFLVIAGLLLGGSASFAAENTVPGDTLFPVKIHINENVRGTFAVTNKAKAEWEVRLVERRLEEFEIIAITPDVLPEVHQIAEQNLEHYSMRVKSRISEFENDDDSEDALETSLKFSEVLNTHEQVLTGLSTNIIIVPAEVAPTVLVSTTTSNTIVLPSSKNNNDTGTIKKVREVRNDAEKKHKELKTKYNREKDDKRVRAESVDPTIAPAQSPVQETRDVIDNRIRKEEIRTSGKTEDFSNRPKSDTHSEVKKIDDKKDESGRDSKKDERERGRD